MAPTLHRLPAGRAPRVAVVCEPRYRVQRQPAALTERLRRAGVDVHDTPDALDTGDVLVIRGRSDALLRSAELAESRGVTVVNRPSAVRRVVDKVAMGRALRAAHLPSPLEWTGRWSRLCRELAGHDAPLVVKPRFGDNGRDVHVVASGAELASVAWNEPAAIVQAFVPNDGADLKLYAVGGRVWAVRKTSPLPGAPIVASEPVAMTKALVRIAATCRLEFGLDLFGVDCVLGPQGPVVLEVNDFPNYSGLDDADDALARYVLGATGRSVRTRTPDALPTRPIATVGAHP